MKDCENERVKDLCWKCDYSIHRYRHQSYVPIKRHKYKLVLFTRHLFITTLFSMLKWKIILYLWKNNRLIKNKTSIINSLWINAKRWDSFTQRNENRVREKQWKLKNHVAQLRNVHSVWKLDRNSQADALFSFSLFRSLRVNSGRHLCLIYSEEKNFLKRLSHFFSCWSAKNKLANNFSCFFFLLVTLKKKLSTFAFSHIHILRYT